MESLTRTLFELSPAGAMLLRPHYDEQQQLVDFTYGQLNLAAQHMLRLPAQPPETFLTLFPVAVASGVFAFYRDTFEAGGPDYFGVDYRADGLDVYYQLAAQRDGDFLVVSFTDTADRRQGDMATALQRSHRAAQQAQAEAEAERALLHALLSQAPVAIGLFVGEELRLAMANTHLAAFWGRTPAQVVGRPLLEIMPGAVGQDFLERLRQVVRTQVPVSAVEDPVVLQLAGQPEQTRYFDSIYQSLYAADNAVLGTVTVAMDVTEKVLARRQVEQLNQQLEQRVQQRTQQLATSNGELTLINEHLEELNRQLTRTNGDLDSFVYTASHDLKAPITNIEGLLYALAEELPAAAAAAPATAHLLALMRDSLGRFQTTLRHLTTFTRLHSEPGQAAEPVDLVALIEDVRLDLAASFAHTQAELRVEAPACPPVRSSPKMLRSIVFNLLSNALKYRAPGRPPRIRMRVNCPVAEGPLELAVEDNGLGLSAAQQQRLFGLFERLHPQVEGAGVGLYSIKRLIDQAGGTIRVASTPDVGSTFTVTLPQAPA